MRAALSAWCIAVSHDLHAMALAYEELRIPIQIAIFPAKKKRY
jgi:hypothetical protein